MNNKKSAEASLENQKSLNFLLGLVLVLSLIYIVLEWSDKDVKIYDKPQIVFEDNTDMDIIQNFQDIMFSLPPEDIEPEASAVIEEIDIVTNSVEVAEINFQPNESELLIDDTSFAEDVLPDNELQEDNIFHFVDKMPMFVGGEAALMRWLNDNIQYPANAQIYGIQGKVICQFIVNR
ncbi:MAG: hypothetical protein LBV75_04945, partial [Paludibacter sp.]|nr:hypothetical protein [Paludibacter sp.]